MRVVTLLPAATEIVAALGEVDALVGISHECDYPPAITHLPRVTTTWVDTSASGASIDREVRRLRQSGHPGIALDAGQLRRLSPDLIITQELCEVCAVEEGQVRRLAATLRPTPQVLPLRAHDLQGIWNDIRAVGAALNRDEEAEGLVLGLRSRLQQLRSGVQLARPRVLCIEWLEPLYVAGHWVPELVAAAGAEDIGAQPGSHSERRQWAELIRLNPELILIMLCGFGVERARIELERLADPAALDLLSRVPTWIIDGNSYTSRSGPRVVDGAGRIRSAIAGQPADGLQLWHPAAVC